jgi:hypothetical protein
MITILVPAGGVGQCGPIKPDVLRKGHAIGLELSGEGHIREYAYMLTRSYACMLISNMLICMHVDLFTCMHVDLFMDACRHVHIHEYRLDHMHACRHAHMHECRLVNMHACRHVHMDACRHVYMHACRLVYGPLGNCRTTAN